MLNFKREFVARSIPINLNAINQTYVPLAKSGEEEGVRKREEKWEEEREENKDGEGGRYLIIHQYKNRWPSVTL